MASVLDWSDVSRGCDWLTGKRWEPHQLGVQAANQGNSRFNQSGPGHCAYSGEEHTLIGGDGVGGGVRLRPADRDMADTKNAEAAGVEQSGGGDSAPRRGTTRFSGAPSLEEIRKLQAQFTDERDWDQFHQPRNLLLALVGEVGELAELFQWRGEVAEGLPGWTDAERTALRHELSDVLLYLVELSDKCGVDLPKAVLEKLELNRLKYPAVLVRGSARKYTEYSS